MAHKWDFRFDVVCIGDAECADVLEDCGVWAFIWGD